jgi:hypothetical protein
MPDARCPTMALYVGSKGTLAYAELYQLGRRVGSARGKPLLKRLAIGHGRRRSKMAGRIRPSVQQRFRYAARFRFSLAGSITVVSGSDADGGRMQWPMFSPWPTHGNDPTRPADTAVCSTHNASAAPARAARNGGTEFESRR